MGEFSVLLGWKCYALENRIHFREKSGVSKAVGEVLRIGVARLGGVCFSLWVEIRKLDACEAFMKSFPFCSPARVVVFSGCDAFNISNCFLESLFVSLAGMRGDPAESRSDPTLLISPYEEVEGSFC